MRIIWDNENYFQAELDPSNWQQEKDIAKEAGFKTSGPPQWLWHTSKPSVLNKLRKLKPTNLTITEAALQKYNQFNEQEHKKLELKKDFEKQKRQLDKQESDSKRKEYEDQNGIVCIYVEPSFAPQHVKYVPPAQPDEYCFVCGDAVYSYDYPDLCLWCSKSF